MEVPATIYFFYFKAYSRPTDITLRILIQILVLFKIYFYMMKYHRPVLNTFEVNHFKSEFYLYSRENFLRGDFPNFLFVVPGTKRRLRTS